MADQRTKHLRRLRRLLSSARRWSVLGGGLAGATAVLVPYDGLGLGDAGWAAGAGASVALAIWRWRDYREMKALPVPEPTDPATAAAELRRKVVSAVSSVPAGQTAITELRRQRARMKYRGLAVAPLWMRLDRASMTFAGIAPRLNGVAADAVVEAAAAERTLYDLVERAAHVERTMKTIPGLPAGTAGVADSRHGLAAAHQDLMGQITEGVVAYERLVAAGAGYIAEDGRMSGKFLDPAATRLTEAADLLRGVSAGLADLRTNMP
jgi:hypothetical protein